MKKNYEKKDGFIIICIVFLIVQSLIMMFLFNRRVVIYEKFAGIVSKRNLVLFLLNDDELDLFFKNKVFYVNNRKKKFNIKKVENDVLKKDGVFYNQVFVEVNIPNMYGVNDAIDFSIAEKSVKSIEIFKIIWEGD